LCAALAGTSDEKEQILVETTHYQGSGIRALTIYLQELYSECRRARRVWSSMAERMLNAAARRAGRPPERHRPAAVRTACRNDFSSAQRFFRSPPSVVQSHPNGGLEGVSANDIRLCRENFSSWVTRI
jgi:hypothetical protein